MAMSPNATEKPQKETLEDIASTAAQAADSVLEGNHMIDEGAQTTVNHYNEQQHQIIKTFANNSSDMYYY